MNVTTERNTEAAPSPVDAYRQITLGNIHAARDIVRDGFEDRPETHPLKVWVDYHSTVVDGFTQRALAKWLGLTPAFLNQLIHGYRRHGPGAARTFCASCNAFVGDHPLAIPMELEDVRPDVWR